MPENSLGLISWNICSENSDIDHALRSIVEKDVDVVCIQEVPWSGVRHLQKLSAYTIQYAKDFSRMFSRREHTYYLVIITKCEIVGEKKFKFKRLRRQSRAARKMHIKEGLEYHYIDIVWDGTALRIFNVHFDAYGGPKRRIDQFKTVVNSFDPERLNIICGDLNCGDPGVPAGRFIKACVQLHYGISSEESWMVESAIFEQMFRQFGLQNALGNCVTFPSTFSQLDFILIPQGADINATVISKNPGSDHYPVSAEVTIGSVEKENIQN